MTCAGCEMLACMRMCACVCVYMCGCMHVWVYAYTYTDLDKLGVVFRARKEGVGDVRKMRDSFLDILMCLACLKCFRVDRIL